MKALIHSRQEQYTGRIPLLGDDTPTGKGKKVVVSNSAFNVTWVNGSLQIQAEDRDHDYNEETRPQVRREAILTFTRDDLKRILAEAMKDSEVSKQIRDPLVVAQKSNAQVLSALGEGL